MPIFSPPVSDRSLRSFLAETKRILNLLGGHKILSRSIPCPKCTTTQQKAECSFVKNHKDWQQQKYSSGYHFECSLKSYHVYAITKDSYLYNSQITFQQHLELLYYFYHGANVVKTADRLELSRKCVIYYFRIFRKCLSKAVDKYYNEHQIGQYKLTEADESKFNHKRKHNRGNKKSDNNWVVGIVERDTGRCFLVQVDKRDKKTLTEIITKVVRKEATVITDQWRGYVSLGDVGYVHISINHSVTFRDPMTGEYSNTIEGLFNLAKKKFKQMNGIPREFTQEYLNEFTWRRLHTSLSKEEAFSKMLVAIATHQKSVIKNL